MRREMLCEDVLLTRSDHFICPSPAVQDDLVTNFGIAQGRTSLVPYGVHRCWLTVETRPARGRILFVGEANLRKGIHYFAMAAARLRRTSRGYALRVAGGVTPRVAEQSLCRGLEFLGRIPRDRLREEFAAADVFVLPSLWEGSAEATYEALAAGLPVVTTRAAGSVVRDGIEGRIVPERDPVALADGVAEIVEDRDKRARMSVAARERARDYTWERYGERLVGALKTLPG
jgi:glycosyltransferase involved in cell wall biosynthesis